ncbi:MAG: cytochrome c biogenesis protein ResB [Deltaproteobacteria bacterium]|nr:cytochrome c biogenesis protein ResB [Deltaproteobacteria bacterium]
MKKSNVIWSFFSSVNLTIVLFILIVLLFVAGSLIPQQEAAREFARNIPPGLASAFQKMQFFDLYHSIWFFLIMGLLSLNLITCSLSRFHITWQRFRAKVLPDSFTSLENLSPALTTLTEERHDITIQKLEDILKKKYRKVEKKETGQGCILYGEKGRFSHFGVYVIHLSILIIIGGAVIGSLFGFDAYVQVAEGDAVDTIQLKGERGTKKLNFTLRCDRFNVDFYEDGLPREYRSDLTFLKNDRVVYQGSLLVNHPIIFEGLRFYQTSYGTVPDGHAQVQVLQIFSLDHIYRRYYTGLQIAYDPGLPIVASGAFLMFAGFMVVFFSSHRRVWIGAESQGDSTRITIAGRTNRDSRRLHMEMEYIMAEYTKVGS